MIQINLLPEELRRKEKVHIALPDIPIKKTLYWAGGGLLVLQLLMTAAGIHAHFQLNSAQKEVDALKEQTREIVKQKKETEAVFTQLKEVRLLTTRRFRWAELLSAVTNSMTKGVWLRSMKVTEEEGAVSDTKEKKAPQRQKYLVLAGSAVGTGQETAFIGKFLKQLKDNPFFQQLFSDIKPSNITQRRSGDYEVYDFTISCQFRKDKAP